MTVVVDTWTGARAAALRAALRMSNESFAEHLGTAPRTVVKWNTTPALVPLPELQRALDTALARASDEDRYRFELLQQGTSGGDVAAGETGADRAGHEAQDASDLVSADVLQWLDDSAHRPAGWARREVRATTRRVRASDLEYRAQRRGRVTRHEIASTLKAFYGPTLDPPYSFYSASLDGVKVGTSIISRPEWDHIATGYFGELSAAFLPSAGDRGASLLNGGEAAAVTRLAEAAVAGTRFVNAPLYSLHEIEVSGGAVEASFTLARFAEYALTLDLLEAELLDSTTEAGDSPLPLRSLYLPDLASIVRTGARLCVGGPVALTAIARPADRRRGRPADYVILVQERCGRVLNSAHETVRRTV